MLGTLHDKWDRSKSVAVRDGQKMITVRGKRLEVKIEENNHLRLSLVEIVDNRATQHSEATANVLNLLDNRRKDLAMIKRELKQITQKLVNEDLTESDEEDLFQEIRDKKAIKKNHESEIPKLVAQETVRVNYRVIKTGLSAVLPPGLTLHPEFLAEPVCWCPQNFPESHPVEETTPMSEDMPLITQHFKGSGFGLEFIPDEEAQFSVTAKDIAGEPCDVYVDNFAVESKEAEITSTVVRKVKGVYEVSYSLAPDVEEYEQIFLGVTYLGRHIEGSPFTVKDRELLLEVSSSANLNDDWLDKAVGAMSSIPRAKLWIHLLDGNGSEVYKATGITSCRWTQNHITAPSRQYYENRHTNIIRLDNGDSMMIIGKTGIENSFSNWGIDAYRSYNIIINKGYFNPSDYNRSRRRLIIARSAPSVPNWSTPGNLISYSSAGFMQTCDGNWPKFNGTFRIYYKAL